MSGDKRTFLAEIAFQLSEAFKMRDRRRAALHLDLAKGQIDGLRATHTTFLGILLELKQALQGLALALEARPNDIEPLLESLEATLSRVEEARNVDRAGRRERWEAARALSEAESLTGQFAILVLNQNEQELLRGFLITVARYAQTEAHYAHRVATALDVVHRLLARWRSCDERDEHDLEHAMAILRDTETGLVAGWGRCSEAYVRFDVAMRHKISLPQPSSA